jgi:hypothetical protein
MSRSQWRSVAVLALAILVMVPALGVGQPPDQLRPVAARAAAGLALPDLVQAWRTVLAVWLPLDGAAAAVRHRSRGRGFGPSPTCDNGILIDPDGRCVKTAPVLRPTPTCDNGLLIDPNGHCVTAVPVLQPAGACDNGVLIDPSGQCRPH